MLSFFMWIYKITNLLNNKVYIGQTIRTDQSRWRRHILDAKNNKLNTHFARAIRKYGEENFSVEIIDTANSAEELTQKEVAKKLNISQSYISRIEKKVIKKLKTIIKI